MTDTPALTCTACGTTCELAVAAQSCDNPEVRSLRPAQGWTYDSDHGWRCPECKGTN